MLSVQQTVCYGVHISLQIGALAAPQVKLAITLPTEPRKVVEFLLYGSAK
jgi:hypothetical protein